MLCTLQGGMGISIIVSIEYLMQLFQKEKALIILNSQGFFGT
jgi:hypothetical protein